MDHTSARRHGAVLLVTALVAALLGVVAPPATADRGGPPAPGWHWVDSTEPDGPAVSTASLGNLGVLLPQASGDDTVQSVTAAFPVTLDGVTGTALMVSSNGFVAVSDGARTVSLRALTNDMVTQRTWMRTLGEPGSRQLVIHFDRITRFGQSGGPASVTVTFVEGERGGLVSFLAIDTPWDAEVGLHEGVDRGGPSSILRYTGPIVSGRSVLFTDAADSDLPTLLTPVDDARGYRKIEGQPTGSADLRGSGRVVLPTSDSGTRTLPLPFPFTFNGIERTQVSVGADAVFAFGAGSLPPRNRPPELFPDAAFPDSGALFSDDLVTSVSTQVRGTAPQRQFVVQWVGNRFSDASATGAFDGSLVLFEDGSDLGFVYADVPTGPQPFIGLNYDGLARQQHLGTLTDGDALLWTTRAGATQAVEQPPVGGTNTDAFGYRAVPAPYDFIDASDGTAYLVGSDDAVTSIPAPFPVSLYGTDATEVSVSSNGFLTVGSVATSRGLDTLPLTDLAGLVRPYEADLVSDPAVYAKTVGSAPHRRFVVMWDARSFGNPGLTTRYEVVFAEDTTDVLVQYDEIDQITGPIPGGAVGINKGDGETRLQHAASARDIPDDTAVRFTTDRLLGLTAPASISPGGQPVALGNVVRNVAETPVGAIRQEIRLDGVAGLEAEDLTLEARDGETWVELPLTGAGGVLSTIVTPIDGVSFGPGVDRSTPLRLSLAPGAPLGQLQIGTSLVRLTGGAPSGRIAASTTTTSLVETVPAAPVDVVATPGDGSAVVSWTAPSDGGRPILGYTVTRMPGGTVLEVDPDDTSASFAGLANGTAYTFAVVATNDLGDSLPGLSTPVTPFGLPGAPTGVSAARGDTTASVSWSAAAANGSPVTGYTVTASPGGATAAVGGGATSAVVPDLVNGTAYTFTVRASNAAGDGASSAPSVAVTPAGVPGAAGSVVAVPGDEQVTVSWAAAAANGGAVTGYTVTASPGGATAAVGGGPTSATVSGLSNGTAYTFTVRASNAVGDGIASTPTAAVTPFGVPGAPVGVSAVRGDQQASVSWTAAGANGSPVTGYTVTASPGGATAAVGGGASSAVVSGLVNGTAYTFTVRAGNAAGDGAPSAPSAAVTPAGVPGVAGSVAAVPGDEQATVSWTAAAPNGSAVTGYTVTASPGGATAAVGGGASSAVVSGLVNGTAYTFTVRAANVVGDGIASTPTAAVTPLGVPGAPGRPSAVAGNGAATVTWPASAPNGSPVTGYTVTASPSGATVTVAGDQTSAAVPGLTNGTAYTFTVVATNAAGDGAASAASAPVTPRAPQVAVRVRSALKPASVKKGKTAKLYGTLAPSPTSGTVVLERQQGARWVAAGTARLRLQVLPDRRRVVGYVFTIKARAKGRFTYRVAYRGSAGFRAATGPAHRLVVK